jgi:hypothetical protein
VASFALDRQLRLKGPFGILPSLSYEAPYVGGLEYEPPDASPEAKHRLRTCLGEAELLRNGLKVDKLHIESRLQRLFPQGLLRLCEPRILHS